MFSTINLFLKSYIEVIYLYKKTVLLSAGYSGMVTQHWGKNEDILDVSRSLVLDNITSHALKSFQIIPNCNNIACYSRVDKLFTHIYYLVKILSKVIIKISVLNYFVKYSTVDYPGGPEDVVLNNQITDCYLLPGLVLLFHATPFLFFYCLFYCECTYINNILFFKVDIVQNK